MDGNYILFSDCEGKYANSKFLNLYGKKYNSLTVISKPYRNMDNRMPYYICRCDCGNEILVRAYGIVDGSTKSCGCIKRGKPNFKNRKTNYYEIRGDTVCVKIGGCDKDMICDREDWERLKDHYWLMGSDGYARTNLHATDWLTVKKFHMAVIGKKEGLVIDHINRNKLDNRKCNLRHVTKQANTVNYSIAKNNTTGVTGVYHRKDTGRWKATIFVSGKEIPLGHYATKKEAAAARKAGEEKYFSPLFKEGNEHERVC